MHRNFYRESQLIQRHQLLNEVLFILIFEILPFELNPIFFAQHVFFDRFHLTNVNLVFLRVYIRYWCSLIRFCLFSIYFFTSHFSLFTSVFRNCVHSAVNIEHWTLNMFSTRSEYKRNFQCVYLRKKKKITIANKMFDTEFPE